MACLSRRKPTTCSMLKGIGPSLVTVKHLSFTRPLSREIEK
jgi:hypothetical protein